MSSSNQVEPTDRDLRPHAPQKKKLCNLHHLLQFASSLLLPLMLGIFTVVITFQQDSSAKKQRLEDREAARQQRQQDQLAAQQLRELEKSLSDDRYYNGVFDQYIKDMATLLRENQGSFQTMDFVSILARAKTLNVFRQLDPGRIISVIRFLYEARQLSSGNQSSPLDLSTAELNGVDFRKLAGKKKLLDQISLAGILFDNATFQGLRMRYVNLSSAELDHTLLSSARLTHSDLSSTVFDHTDVTKTQLRNVTMSSAVMDHTNCASTHLLTVNLSHAELNHVDFSSAVLFNVSFVKTKLANMDFSDALLKDVDFSFAELSHINFTSTRMQNVSFTSAKLQDVNFASDNSLNYYHTHISFVESTLDQVNFSSVKFYIIDFTLSQHTDTDFSFATLAAAKFCDARAPKSSFHGASCLKADFTKANLTGSDFGHTNAKGANFGEADLNEVNFSGAILQNVRFKDITDQQLAEASSVHHAQLGNGTRLSDPSVVKNGAADCSVRVETDWKVIDGEVIVKRWQDKSNDCYFAPGSASEGAIMSQRLDLSWMKNMKYFADSRVMVRGEMGTGVFVEVVGVTDTNPITAETNLSSQINTTYFYLHENVKEVEIFVYFHPADNESDVVGRWCDDLVSYVDYGPDILAPPRVEPMIPFSVRWSQKAELLIGKQEDGAQIVESITLSGLFVDYDQSIYVADVASHRIVLYRWGATSVEIVAGGTGRGNLLHQLNEPSDVLFDRETNSLLICDLGNARVMRWYMDSGGPDNETKSGETILDNIACFGLAMDDRRFIYVSDKNHHQVKRYKLGETRGTIVAGGHGAGNGLHQLDNPTYIFVDQDYAIYVSDARNDRVMKWVKGAKEGRIVAGGHGGGKALNQISGPLGLWVDRFQNVYVADFRNSRVMYWKSGTEEGKVIVKDNRDAKDLIQMFDPHGLFFDRDGNMYITEYFTDRLQRFIMHVN